jgi:peroxidase
MHRYVFLATLLLVVATIVGIGSVGADPFSGRTLDGSGNNAPHPAWGKAGALYSRVASPNYADGKGQMVSGPSPRYISNRIFNDQGQNLFSENGISQWGWAWGQFIDHDIGLRDETPAENADMPYDRHDKLEDFSNDVGTLGFARTPAAPGTGGSTPRQQVNTISSFIDASNVYGNTNSRLDWLRNGTVDGNPSNNAATLLMSAGNYLPRVTARGNASTAPPMDLMGALMGTPTRAVVAGDVRANENVALTAIQTLFAREHNRVVAALPASLTAQQKFEVARRVVGAEAEYITYNEFLPSLGVNLARYRGYSSFVNPTLSNEFAVVGYRAHSMIHGEFDATVPAGTYTDNELNTVFPAEGITVERNDDGTVELTIPLVVAFGNPDLLEQIGEGTILQSLGAERQYKNDEQFDNSLRSVLFEVPKPNGQSPPSCGAPVIKPSCFTDVSDLAADDIQRGRDHGMPSYNDLRSAYGLSRVRSFTQLTGESTDRFSANDPKIDPNDPIDDPDILTFMELRDAEGNVIPLGSEEAGEEAVSGVRRTTLAARLRAIYGNVDNVEGFVGMVAEPHVQGAEFGPLQRAIWKRQFEALRDGDRFFYLNDPELQTIRQNYGIDYRHTLAELIQLDAGTTVEPNVFEAAD